MDSTKTNQIAYFRLCSWLDAVKITYKLTNEALFIKDALGKFKKVLVKESGSRFSIKPSSLNNRDVAIALLSFKKLVESLGFTYVPPVTREIANKRLNFDDNFELISMRHCDLRRSPNPPDEVFKKYKKITDLACYKFFSFNYALCKRNLLEINDLKVYANIWLINYLGNFKNPNDSDREAKNKLSYYLTQKFFCEFKGFLERKEERCMPDFNDFCLSSFGALPENLNLSTEILPKSEEERKDEALQELRRRLYRLPTRVAKRKLMSVYTQKNTNKYTKKIIETILEEIS